MKILDSRAGGRERSRAAEKALGIAGALLIPAAVIYLEILLRLTAKMEVIHSGLAGGLCTALAFALAASALCALPGKSAAKWLRFLFVELFTVWYLVAFFINDSYKVFMAPSIILSTAGAAARDFGGNVAAAIGNGLPVIGIFHFPALLCLLLPGGRPAGRVRRRLIPAGIMLVLAAAALFGGVFFSTCTPELKTRYESEYNYDGAVKYFGLLSALTQEFRASVYPGGQAAGFSTTTATAAPAASPAAESEPVETAAPEYGLNVMDIDFQSINPGGNSNLAELNAYVESLEPTSKNRYTGIFEGKNLILITAEAFSKEVIDKDRTPTLYRLANQGIVFEDFYQPAWGGSTSTGEYSWLTGLAPTDPMAMMYSAQNNLFFTMGNQLQRQGYYSAAYHNGSYTYYNRDYTHCNLGYSRFVGIGNGLEEGMTGGFPASDLEMFDFTLPQYVDKQPFSVYYMSISGHASYAFSEEVNDMAVKNRAVTENMTCSEAVKAYYACNQELEYGLESLVSGLEKAGIADDTVIAIVPDHYPYGLMPSAAWGFNTNYLEQLYGFPADTNPARDHNAAIIWCGSLEALDEPIVVPGPTSSLDILPTLLNLFGLEYDSRLLAGRDALSGAEPLVFWNDYSWLTDKGYYDSAARSFRPNGGVEADEEYIQMMNDQVKDRLRLSGKIASLDYYGMLFGPDEIK